MFTKENLLNEEWSFSTIDPEEFVQACDRYECHVEWIQSPVDSFCMEHDADSYILGYHNIEQFNYAKMPLAASAMKTAIERGGISGPALSRLSQKPFEDVMNTCYSVGKGESKIYTVAGKIYAALSDGYVVLNIPEVMGAANDGVANCYCKSRFLSGHINHQHAVAEYDLSCHTEIAQLYMKKIAQIKESIGDTSPMDNWQLKPMVRIMTSNTGLSGANVYPYFLRKSGAGGGYIAFPFAKPITLEHKGNSSIAKFRENMKMLGSSFREGVEQFANLQKIVINHPVNCFKNVAKRVGLPKKLACLAAVDFEAFVNGDETSAGNLYIGLTEILNYAYKEGKNAEYIFSLQDLLSRVLTLKFSDYDLPYCDWDCESKPQSLLVA